MEEEETRRQGVPLGRRFYDKYDKFRPDCKNIKNMT